MISAMIEDAIVETQRRINKLKLQSADDVRACGQQVVAFGDVMSANDRALKAFLFKNMYRHSKVTAMMAQAKRVVSDLFALFLREPSVMPAQWSDLCDGPSTARTARVVSDYIAGMTDRFALEEHRRLFTSDGDTP
jgi:dGTPase